VKLLPEYIRPLLTRYVEQGGTLILGAYGSYSKQEAARDIAQDLAAAGFRVAGSSSRGKLPLARVAWIRAEQEPGADRQQRPLRSRRWRRLIPGVRRPVSQGELAGPRGSAKGATVPR
jgi:GAF domain-containing protein